MNKPKLSTQQQIDHLKHKGVKFTIVSEDKAFKYLAENNNFFKLTAYRKNYIKNAQGKYVNLEFAYLRDLAIMDMRMRKCLLDMALDIEHATRGAIIRAIEDSSEDGYSVVSDFITVNGIDNTYSDAHNSPYCKDIINKYEGDMPIWAFVEISQFGRLCQLFKFVAERFNDKQMKNQYYLLQEVRRLRNACAHSNCILNDLKSSATQKYTADSSLVHAVHKAGVSSDSRKKKLSNERIRQIVTLLFYYKSYVTSKGLQKYQSHQLHEVFFRRPSENYEFYRNAEQITSFFEFMRKLVDNWFPN